jgi:hypothetical protein
MKIKVSEETSYCFGSEKHDIKKLGLKHITGANKFAKKFIDKKILRTKKYVLDKIRVINDMIVCYSDNGAICILNKDNEEILSVERGVSIEDVMISDDFIIISNKKNKIISIYDKSGKVIKEHNEKNTKIISTYHDKEVVIIIERLQTTPYQETVHKSYIYSLNGTGLKKEVVGKAFRRGNNLVIEDIKNKKCKIFDLEMNLVLTLPLNHVISEHGFIVQYDESFSKMIAIFNKNGKKIFTEKDGSALILDHAIYVKNQEKSNVKMKNSDGKLIVNDKRKRESKYTFELDGKFIKEYRNGKYRSLFNCNGSKTIEGEYDAINVKSEDLICTQAKNESLTFYNGKVVIEPKGYSYTPNEQNKNRVGEVRKIGEARVYKGIIDSKNKIKILYDTCQIQELPFNYYLVRKYGENYQDGKVGIIDKDGNFVKDCIYYSFIEKDGVVSLRHKNSQESIYCIFTEGGIKTIKSCNIPEEIVKKATDFTFIKYLITELDKKKIFNNNYRHEYSYLELLDMKDAKVVSDYGAKIVIEPIYDLDLKMNGNVCSSYSFETEEARKKAKEHIDEELGNAVISYRAESFQKVKGNK